MMEEQRNPPDGPGRAWGIPLGRVAGVPVFLTASWVLLALLITITYRGYLAVRRPELPGSLAYLVGAGLVLCLLMSVLLHELGHALTARRFGMGVRGITLELLGLFSDGGTPEELLGSARGLLDGYFAVEDPRRLDPAEREYLVTTEVDEGRLLLRGYIDRLDVSPGGDLRVVDYKTGGAPREAFEARALFQLKFYALVLWRTRGVVPRVLRLLYLKDAEICDYTPDTEELSRFERTLVALWEAIARATAAREFRPKPSRLCGWCAHQALCPAFDGTPPPFPERPSPPGPEGPIADE